MHQEDAGNNEKDENGGEEGETGTTKALGKRILPTYWE